MRVVRLYQRAFAVLAMLALVANVVATAICHVPAASAGGLVDDILGPLTICTTDGTGNIVHGGPEPGGKKADSGCTFCTLWKTFALTIALAFAAIVFPVTIVPAPLGQRVATLAEHLSRGSVRSRAPPLPA